MFTYCITDLTKMAPATKKKKATGVSRSYTVLRKPTLDPKKKFPAREHHVQPPRPVHTWQLEWPSGDARDHPESTCTARRELPRTPSSTRKTKTARQRPPPSRFVRRRLNAEKPPKKPPRRSVRPRSVRPRSVKPRSVRPRSVRLRRPPRSEGRSAGCLKCCSFEK